MKTTKIQRKAAYFLACIMGLLFIVSGCSSDDAAQVIADEFINISGTVKTIANPAGEEGVTVKGIYSDGNPLNPSTTTGAGGAFSLPVLKNTAVSVQLSKTDLLTLNSAREAFSADAAGFDVELPTTVEANALMALVFPGQTLASGAWLVLTVEDAAGTEVNGATITTTQANIIDEAATECDDLDSGGVVTIAPCNPPRDGPMYWAYFSADQDVTVSVSGVTGSQTGPVRNGEVTYLDFEQ